MLYTYACMRLYTFICRAAFHKAHTIIQNSRFCYALYDTDTLLHPLTTKVTL